MFVWNIQIYAKIVYDLSYTAILIKLLRVRPQFYRHTDVSTVYVATNYVSAGENKDRSKIKGHSHNLDSHNIPNPYPVFLQIEFWKTVEKMGLVVYFHFTFYLRLTSAFHLFFSYLVIHSAKIVTCKGGTLFSTSSWVIV
jgi:hypothetical protein